MKQIVAVAILTLFASNAYASCKSEASEKKLAGAALNSFMKKCEGDAKSTCEKSAVDMKLAGAAKTSHVKKCVTDTVGN